MTKGEKKIIEFATEGFKPVKIETTVISVDNGEAIFEDQYGSKYKGLFKGGMWCVKKINV